jgi:hypothetical protein
MGTVEYEYLSKEEWDDYSDQRNSFAGCMMIPVIIFIIYLLVQ